MCKSISQITTKYANVDQPSLAKTFVEPVTTEQRVVENGFFEYGSSRYQSLLILHPGKLYFIS